jgi:hypothetical protein
MYPVVKVELKFLHGHKKAFDYSIIKEVQVKTVSQSVTISMFRVE